MRSEGASIIICVSHQRVPRDRMLCEKAAHLIDEVLGGHDHHYEVSEPIGPQGLHYVKSGTDFRSFTVVDLLIKKNPNYDEKVATTASAASGDGASLSSDTSRKKYIVQQFDSVRIECKKAEPTDVEIDEIIHGFNAKSEERMKKVIGESGVDLDGRFDVIRTRESNVSNFIADCLRRSTVVPNHRREVDIALINSGTLRADRIIPAGPFTIRDLMNVLPMLSHLVVLQVNGEQLLATLNNGVCQYPALEVSKMRCPADASRLLTHANHIRFDEGHIRAGFDLMSCGSVTTSSGAFRPH